MRYYKDRVLPFLIDRAMRHKALRALREGQMARARGRVLEIGIGSGLNLPYYHREVAEVVGIDPSAKLLARARRHAAWTHFPVRLIEGTAEQLPVEDGSIDSVVMTWTLCSVADAPQVLREVRRVLRGGGTFVFIEHGQAPEARVRRWQARLTPCWRRIAGGCHLDRPVDRLLTEAGLQLTRLETGYLVPGPRVLTFHYLGCALRPADAPGGRAAQASQEAPAQPCG